MGASDQVLANITDEIEERRAFQNGLADDALNSKRDMTTQEMEVYQRANDRIAELEAQRAPLVEANKIAKVSQARTAEIQSHASREAGAPVEYRSAGAYIADMYYGQLGDRDAAGRLEMFHRAAAHQTTADNPGLLPESIVQPVVNFIEVARPLCATLGPQDLGPGAWSYARVTQHTLVAKQAGEKTELASRKMTVTKTPLGADTFGGYVNISKQDINRSSPAILDMVINDLAAEYAIETELELGTVLFAAATGGPIVAAGATPAEVAAAIYGAAGQVFAACKGQGTTVVAVSPDMLGVVAPMFPGVNPSNAYSTGFSAANIGQGPQGSISGLTVIMSAGLATGTVLVYSTAAAKAFEYKYGNLQVVEPSVWGVQVGYAGDFDAVVIEPTGVVKIGLTP